MRAYVAALPAAEASLRLYGASRHELFDDRERTAVIADLLSWLHGLVHPQPPA